jgi:hypothetical protein
MIWNRAPPLEIRSVAALNTWWFVSDIVAEYTSTPSMKTLSVGVAGPRPRSHQ